MIDKQQFETMATELSNSNARNGLNLYESEVDLLAIDLYNAGYRKIDENAVLLTEEEIEHPTRVDVIEFFVNHNAKVRKETAKEIFTKLREKSIESFLDWEGNVCHLGEEYVSMKDIEAVLKQFGVEVPND